MSKQSGIEPACFRLLTLVEETLSRHGKYPKLSTRGTSLLFSGKYFQPKSVWIEFPGPGLTPASAPIHEAKIQPDQESVQPYQARP